MAQKFNGITTGAIRREVFEKYGIRIFPSGYYRLARMLGFPVGNRAKTEKGWAWTIYTEPEKNIIIKLIKTRFGVI